ncbi:hypothetical protein FHW74_000967 [Atlantibacter sp. RC6]|nr:hypothetical protein [Atlantibacter sp. RC6]
MAPKGAIFFIHRQKLNCVLIVREMTHSVMVLIREIVYEKEGNHHIFVHAIGRPRFR